VPIVILKCKVWVYPLALESVRINGITIPFILLSQAKTVKLLELLVTVELGAILPK
jgi:hypothetical protein